MRPLRACIDARIESGIFGGVEQFVIGLAAGLSKLEDGDDEYLFLTTPGKDEWIQPYLKGPCRALHVRRPPLSAAPGYRIRRGLADRVPLIPPRRVPPEAIRDVMHSDGTIEAARVDLMHFPSQMAFLTEVPSIYHPHDLQHVHLPELLPARDIELRELWYRAFCEQASLVVMMTSWGKRDLIRHYGLPEEKVAVVNWGSVLGAIPSPSPSGQARTRRELDLPEHFLFYPAQTWRHKNHERLLEALALIRDRHSVAIPLICTGHHYEKFQPRLEAMVRELGLEESVRFLGFVTPLQLRCIYAMARALVFPSRFEGWGMPVCEAFESGIPVATSSATGMPEVVGNAALVFDPDEPEEIAENVWRLWSDPELRARLVGRGKRRAAELSVDRAAKAFRAHYRWVAGRPLSAEESQLLEGD